MHNSTGGRSTSLGSLKASGAAAAAASAAISNGPSSKTPNTPSPNGPSLNRQLSSSGGASLLASSTGSVRAPSSPAARLKRDAQPGRRVNSLSALDSCGRDSGGKSGDSPSTTRTAGGMVMHGSLRLTAMFSFLQF